MTATAPPGTDMPEHEQTDTRHRTVVIIGSGPAGLTAAIYAARANLEPLVIAGNVPMGQLMITSDVENYPGFPDGIQGPELMQKFRDQATRFGATVLDRDATRVDFTSRPFGIWVGDRRVPRRRRHRGHRRIGPVAGAAVGGGVPRSRRQRLRDLRRLLLPRSRGGRGRRRRHRARGGDVPDPLRGQGDDARAPRRVPRQQDHAGPRQPRPEDRDPLQQGGHRGPRRDDRQLAGTARHGHRRGERPRRAGHVRRHRLQAEHRPVRRAARHR